MKQICITDYKDFDFQEIYEYLIAEKETVFEILINKDEWDEFLPGMENIHIAYDYYMAGFAGQKLSEVASAFGYLVPAINSMDPFRFLVDIPDMEKFVDVLDYIIRGYFGPDDTGSDYAKWEKGFEYQSAIFQDNAWESDEYIACWGLVRIASDQISKDDEPVKYPNNTIN